METAIDPAIREALINEIVEGVAVEYQGRIRELEEEIERLRGTIRESAALIVELK